MQNSDFAYGPPSLVLHFNRDISTPFAPLSSLSPSFAHFKTKPMALPHIVKNQSVKAVPQVSRGRRKAHTRPFRARKRTIPKDVRRVICQLVPEKSIDISGANQVKETSIVKHNGIVFELDLLMNARRDHHERSSVVLHELVQMFVVHELSSRSEALHMLRDKHDIVVQEMKKDFIRLESTRESQLRESQLRKEAREKSGNELDALRKRLLVKEVSDAHWGQTRVSKHHQMVNLMLRDLTDRSISHNEIDGSFQLVLSELTKRAVLQDWTKTHQEKRQSRQNLATVLDEILQTAALRRAVEASKTRYIASAHFKFVLQEVIKLDGRSMTQREARCEKVSGSIFDIHEELIRLSQMRCSIRGHAKEVQQQLFRAFGVKEWIHRAETRQHHREQYCAALKEMTEKVMLRKLEERSKEVNVMQWKASHVLQELKDRWDLLEIEGFKQLVIEELSDMCKALQSSRKRKCCVHHDLFRAFAMRELVRWAEVRERQRTQHREVLQEMAEKLTVQDMMLRSTAIDTLPWKALVELLTLKKRCDWQDNEKSDEFATEQLSAGRAKSDRDCRECATWTKTSAGVVGQAATLILQELNEKLDWVSVNEPNSGKLEYVEVGDRKEWVVC